MTDRPIIFSAPMVCALLEGRKTQTRRLLTPANSLLNGVAAQAAQWARLDYDDAFVDPGPSPAGNPGPYLKVARPDDETRHRVYPRFWPGDRLWVRESIRRDADHGIYAADLAGLSRAAPFCAWPWQNSSLPSIHMPRWASRLTLHVEEVRIQRLLDISDEDAQAEGFTERYLDDGFTDRPIGNGWTVSSPGGWCSPAGAFQIYWQKLHPGWDGYSEPWVVALMFRVERANIDTLTPASVAA